MNADSQDPLLEFLSLCEEAEVAYGLCDSRGTPDLVPYVSRILALIANNPQRRADFERAFCDLWGNGLGPWELISFCMYTLRWPTVRQFIEDVLGEALQRQDWRTIPAAAHILESFEDDWEDAQR